MKIFEKRYSDESLIDLPEHISEAVFAELDIPQDENGFREGTFKVVVTWENEE